MLEGTLTAYGRAMVLVDRHLESGSSLLFTAHREAPARARNHEHKAPSEGS